MTGRRAAGRGLRAWLDRWARTRVAALEEATPAVAPVERARRLGLGLKMFSPEPGVRPEEISALGVEACTLVELQASARPPSDDDLWLLNACLEVEGELRHRQWAVLERLLPLIAAGGGELRLPDERGELVVACRGLLELGWLQSYPITRGPDEP